MLAGPSPEVLVGPIAAATSRMRVGSGGVMLPHYSPFKVAESFSVLAGLFPGRIDLALGRAAGTDPLTTFALQRDRRAAAPDDFRDQLAELLGYLYDSLPADHPFARLGRLPGLPERPEPWLLGSSMQSAVWAAELGVPYAFADFINPRGREIAQVYRERFQPSDRLAAPRLIVGAWTICAESDEEAERLTSSGRMAFRLLRQGRLIQVPPVEKALRFLEGDGPPRGRRLIYGSPPTVRGRLDELASEYVADELMLVNVVYDHEARRRSYELVAEEFGLEAAPAAGSAAGVGEPAQ
jgi:luciferase family oxidoreductase group 1